LRIGGEVFREPPKKNHKTQKVEGNDETPRAAAATVMQGAKTMMTWRRSARPTAAICEPATEPTTIKRGSHRLFICRQRGRGSGVPVAGATLHAAAPPGA
jgi:hypothetical protein